MKTLARIEAQAFLAHVLHVLLVVSPPFMKSVSEQKTTETEVF